MPYAKKEKAGKDAYDKGDMKTGMKRRSRKKVCPFCADKADSIDYKEIAKLRKFVSERGKILPRRISGCCAKHQTTYNRNQKSKTRRIDAFLGRLISKV